ncbi:glutathione S-transferase family protein [Halobacteriovorax sp. YZS-1-1]|uniref:glutathione S-transferase family protein n=1 Tax=unclassified Halobacteriovorax TaxID=2639665 RepID=UPI00399A1457
MNKILYSWSGSDEIESFSPSCSIINRCLSFLNIDFDIKAIPLVSELNGAKDKLSGLPIIQDRDKKFFGVRNAIKYLKELREESELFQVPQSQMVQEQMLRDWALTSLRASCVYMSFINPNGYATIKKKFQKAAKYQFDKQEDLNKVAEPIKEALLHSTFSFDIFRLEPELGNSHFEEQLKYIDGLVTTNEFLLGNQIKLVDIIAYCHLSSSLLAASDFSKKIRPKYPRVSRWLLRVAAQTRSKNNIHPSHLD